MAPKRANEAASPASDKRAKVLCKDVGKALHMAADLSEKSRAMLEAMLPGSIGTPADERDEYQVQVAGMVREILKGVEENLANTVSENQTLLCNYVGQKEELDKVHSEASAGRVAKLEEVEAHRQKQRLSATARKEAEAALAAAEGEQTQNSAAHEASSSEHSQCTSVATASLAVVKEGLPPVSQLQKHTKVLIDFGKQLGFDTSMLNGMSVAAAKLAGNRGPFDVMILQGYEERLQSHMSTLKEKIEMSEAAKADNAEKVQSAGADLEVKRAQEGEATETVRTAEAEYQELVEKERAAEKAVRAHVKTLVSKAEAQVSKAEEKLENFRESCLAGV